MPDSYVVLLMCEDALVRVPMAEALESMGLGVVAVGTVNGAFLALKRFSITSAVVVNPHSEGFDRLIDELRRTPLHRLILNQPENIEMHFRDVACL